MPIAPPDLLASRHVLVRDTLHAARLDALIVTHLPNVFYLTGFAGSAAILVLTLDRLYFITDFRYVAAAESLLQSAAGGDGPDATSRRSSSHVDDVRSEGGLFQLVRVDGSYDETLAGVLRDSGCARVGFEAAHLPVNRFSYLINTLGAAADGGATRPELVPTERVIERPRLRKDAHEVAILRTAAQLLSEVAIGVLRQIAPGYAERELAAAIDWQLRRAGFERPAFETIVAGGPNGALPHARPGSRNLAAGDLVVLDFGGVYDGYCVDLSRTVSLGPPDSEAKRVHSAVLEAQAAAIAAVGPGVAAADVDAAARDVLRRHGLGEAFGHSTGHGLGIEIHEEPRIAQRRPSGARVPESNVSNVSNVGNRGNACNAGDDRLAPGMVFTIEPGAYLPGWGGVRIEDDVVVTATGCEVLTAVPRELVVA